MQVRRRADVDHIEIAHPAELCNIGGSARNTVVGSECMSLGCIDIADRYHLELLWELLECADVEFADAPTDDGNP